MAILRALTMLRERSFVRDGRGSVRVHVREKALDGYLNCKGTPLHAPNHLTLGNVQRRCDDSCQLPITLSTCKRDGELH